jgi:class 3 adenylate cyclase
LAPLCILARSCGAISARRIRLDFTAIGPVVNLVSRLEGLCKPLRKTVLVSGAIAAETEMPLVTLGKHALRGIATPCAVFTLPEN